MNEGAKHPFEESELEESFERSSGPGGQNVNKVATKVILRHLPTGLIVTAQESRFQGRNRAVAREKLAELLRTRAETARMEKVHRRELERRRKAVRPAGVKRRMVEDKRKRGSLKKQRHNLGD